MCGKDSVAGRPRRPAGAVRWPARSPPPDVVRRLPDPLREQQPVFDRTGGVHAAALATADGALLVVREDVGRHNAVDKVTGARVLAGESRAAACLVVSGRAGFELVQKAVAGRHRLAWSRSAPRRASPCGWRASPGWRSTASPRAATVRALRLTGRRGVGSRPLSVART